MASQVKMAFLGKANFSNLYIKEKIIVTNNNLSIDNDDDESRSKESHHFRFIVRYVFSGTQRCVMGEDISIEDLKSPSKNKVGELFIGRYVYNLGKSVLHDVKLFSVLAGSCLYNDMLPSGKTWDDLYSYLKKEWKSKNPNEKRCVGWISFVIFYK